MAVLYLSNWRIVIVRYDLELAVERPIIIIFVTDQGHHKTHSMFGTWRGKNRHSVKEYEKVFLSVYVCVRERGRNGEREIKCVGWCECECVCA
jgi:hypothetical protein